MPEQNPTIGLEQQMMLGYHIVLLHIFGCLNAKGILPFSEAAKSLSETADLLDSVPAKTLDTVRLVIHILEKYSNQGIEPNPTEPPPPTRLH